MPSLDMAISGQGFFIVSQTQAANDIKYTRAGQFRVDANGYITNSSGPVLTGIPCRCAGKCNFNQFEYDCSDSITSFDRLAAGDY